MSLSLVVLAAGVGSRYGGPKQIDRVGPGGATLLDYAAFDARRAGFDRVVLVVREGMEADVREAVGDRIARHVPVAYAVQGGALPPDSSPPPGRTKPWGTGHATLAAAPLLDGPFAVINADDFYGAGSYRVLAEHLRRPQAGPVPEFAIVGFPLRATLSPDGPVSRGVCTVDADGFLVSIREVLKVERDGEDARGARRVGRVATDPRRDPRVAQLLGVHAGARAGARGRLPPLPGRERARAPPPSTSCSRRSRRRWTRARRACASSAGAARGAVSPTPGTGRASWTLLAALTRAGRVPARTSGRDGAPRPDDGRRGRGRSPASPSPARCSPSSRTRAGSSTTRGWRRSNARPAAAASSSSRSTATSSTTPTR